MEFTVELALQKGIEAQKAGKVQEADFYYTAILKAYPKHPDANHNMGILAVDLGKIEVALPFLKTALDENSSVAQYWLSYIGALIKLDRMADAKAVLSQAKGKGVKLNGFDQIQLQLNTQSFEFKNMVLVDEPTESNILDKLKLDKALKLAKKKVKDGLSQEAKNIYQDILERFPRNRKAIDGLQTLANYTSVNTLDNKDPPKEQLTSLLELYNQKKLQQVFNKAQILTKRYTKSLTLWNLVGASAAQIGKLDEAIFAFQKALLIKPSYADAHYNIGNALKDQGKLEQALEAYKKALSVRPDYAEAYLNMGNVLKEQGKLEEAIKVYNQALSINPNYAKAHMNVGNALHEKGKLEEAIDTYKKALSVRPDYAEAYLNMGNVLKDQEKFEEAIKVFNEALSIKPDNAEAYNNIGVVLEQQVKLDEATEAYNKALSINPDYEPAHTNLGFIYLSQGDLKLFIDHRKWRWTTKEGQKKISHLNIPEWDGREPLKGKNIFALGEQGPGDIIMWAPGLEYLKNLGAQVTLQCHAKLVELFKMSFTDIEIEPYRDEKTIGIEDYDYYIPMETLFGYFCISEQKCDKSLDLSAPAQLKREPFLFPKQERIDFWRDRLNKTGKGLYVGISWKSPKITLSRKRNYTELSDWEPLFSHPNITFINLQSKEFEDDILEIKKKYSVDIHNFDDLDHYDDFAEVAALCAALDVCVSVSTAVSTVAAAVGTPTKMLHWRRSSWNNVLFSPPGPKVKIYEKDTWEPWKNCLNSVVMDLKKEN